MKKIFGIIFISLLVFSSALQAQYCAGVSADVIPNNPQTGSHNYFGVRVTLSQTYYQDVTVTGFIYDDGSYNENHPFTLTITSGNLTAETDLNFYETSPADNAGVAISSVSPCPIASLIDVFKSLNPTTLQSTDTVALATYFAPINSQIVGYVQAKYGEDLESICEGEQDWITMAGFLIAMCENYYDNGDSLEQDEIPYAVIESLKGDQIAKMSDLTFNNIGNMTSNHFTNNLTELIEFRPKWVTCALAALTGIGAIESLLSGYGTFGATQVLTIIKSIARRYIGWIGVAFAVYEFGDCMDYW